MPGAVFAVFDGVARAWFRLPHRCRVSVYFCFVAPRFWDRSSDPQGFDDPVGGEAGTAAGIADGGP